MTARCDEKWGNNFLDENFISFVWGNARREKNVLYNFLSLPLSYRGMKTTEAFVIVIHIHGN